jgi:hypothetical protein
MRPRTCPATSEKPGKTRTALIGLFAAGVLRGPSPGIDGPQRTIAPPIGRGRRRARLDGTVHSGCSWLVPATTGGGGAGGGPGVTPGTQPPSVARVIRVAAGGHEVAANHRPVIGHRRGLGAGRAGVVPAVPPVASADRVTHEHARAEAGTVAGGVTALRRGPMGTAGPGPAGRTPAAPGRDVRATGLRARAAGLERQRATPIEFDATRIEWK